MSAYFKAVVYNSVYSACVLNAVLTNAVCLYNASFLPFISANAFYFHALSLFISFFYLHHAMILTFVFPNSMFTPLLLFFYIFFLYERAMSSPEK